MILKKGDIVGRISYGKDILFVIEKIIKTSNGNKFAILKGLTVRIEADAPLEDLELINRKDVRNNIKILDENIQKRIHDWIKGFNSSRFFYPNQIYVTGRILHLDGDKRYAEKSRKYYKQLGLDAIVQNIPENRQSYYVYNLLEKYRPDILVITGHDSMIKNGSNYNDIYNYRNSRYFANTVKEARKWKSPNGELVIFAGACQSFFEVLMASGANFASSPARILIDFIDPLIVAEKVALTSNNRIISINEIADNLRDGLKGIGGTSARGKKKIIIKS